MADDDREQPGQAAPCGCFSIPYQFLVTEENLGMDDHFAEISVLVCSVCGQPWLRYFYEVEAFTASGRWYLGALLLEQVRMLTAADAREILSGLDWYFYGGSYYGGANGRASGRILLNP